MRLKTFFSQIYLTFLLIALLSVLAITWITSRSWHHFYLQELAGELEARARLVAVQVREKLAQDQTAQLDAYLQGAGETHRHPPHRGAG